MKCRVHSIYRHPLKGLTPESLDTVELQSNSGIPNDRRFAIAITSAAKEKASTKWMPKSNFLTLQKYERLAQLKTRFYDETETLCIFRENQEITRGKITNRIGRSTLEEFFNAFMKKDTSSQPKLVEAIGGPTFSDYNKPVISILNLESVKDLERVTREKINPLRFRANIWLEGIKPWLEFEWVQKQIKVGDASLYVTDLIGRCAAINVNPNTGVRDHNILKALHSGYNHTNLGIYTNVDTPGVIKVGDTLEPLAGL